MTRVDTDILAERVVALSPAARALLAAQLRAEPPHQVGDARLVAYIVPNAELDTQAAREYLAQRLPAYMVPAAMICLDELPLTANGKLDRKALPEPFQLVSGAGSIMARNPIEQQLTSIWEQLLGSSEPGIHDDFFELGGHSLLVARMIAQIRELYQVDVPIASFFQHPTIAGLAEQVAIQQWARTSVAAISDSERDEVEL
jgi:acyl carrier protein